MKKYLLVFLFSFLLAIVFKTANAQNESHKHYRFVDVENNASGKFVVFGVSDDGKKYEEIKVNKTTSSSPTDFNETIKLIQKYQDEGWVLNRIQHIDAYKAYLIFEK